jgi:hypothetical protein
MHQKNDYILAQIDLISRLLKKLLESLLSIPSSELTKEQIQFFMGAQITESAESLSVSDLQNIDDDQLISTLKEQFAYTQDSIKHLADLLYTLSTKADDELFLKLKALTLYQHLAAVQNINADFLIFSRIQELQTQINQRK